MRILVDNSVPALVKKVVSDMLNIVGEDLSKRETRSGSDRRCREWDQQLGREPQKVAWVSMFGSSANLCDAACVAAATNEGHERLDNKMFRTLFTKLSQICITSFSILILWLLRMCWIQLVAVLVFHPSVLRNEACCILFCQDHTIRTQTHDNSLIFTLQRLCCTNVFVMCGLHMAVL